MNALASRHSSRSLVTLLCLAFTTPSLAADEPDAPKDGPKGAAVTVLKAAKFCFPNIVEAFGLIIPREETMVRPERLGLKVVDILADAGDTVTAGQNLARLAMPEGGTITLTAGEQPATHSVALDIVDSGTGIPEGIRDRIFDSFLSGRPDGTGLGLAIAKRILVSHHGDIALLTTSHTGTTMRVTLPLAKG